MEVTTSMIKLNEWWIKWWMELSIHWKNYSQDQKQIPATETKKKKKCCQIYWVLCGITTGSVQQEGSYWYLLTGTTLKPLFIAMPTATKTLLHKPNALNSTSTWQRSYFNVEFENVLIQVTVRAAVKYASGLESRLVKVWSKHAWHQLIVQCFACDSLMWNCLKVFTRIYFDC